MKKTRWIAIAVLAAAFGLAVAACGGDDSAEPAEAPAAEPAPAEEPAAEPAPAEEPAAEPAPAEEPAAEPPAEEPAPAEEATGDAANGKAIFTGDAGCAGCHTLADAGASGSVGPNLDDSKPSADEVIDRVTNGAGSMPAFVKNGILTEQDALDLAAYITGVTGG